MTTKGNDTGSERSWVMEECDESDPGSWTFIQPGSETLPDDATSRCTDDADAGEATSSVAPHERTNNLKRVDSLESGSSIDIEILDSVYDSSKPVDMCSQRLPHLICMSMSEDLMAEEEELDPLSISVTNDDASYSCTGSMSNASVTAAAAGEREDDDHVGDCVLVAVTKEITELSIPRCITMEEDKEEEEDEKLRKNKRQRKRERRLIDTKGQEDKENKKVNENVASQKNKNEDGGEIHKKEQNENENENEHAKMPKIVGLKGGKKAQPLEEQTPIVSSQMLTVLCASQWILDAACGAFNQSGQPYGSWPRQMPRKLQKHHLHQQAPAPQHRTIGGAPNPRVHHRAQALQPRKQRNRQ